MLQAMTGTILNCAGILIGAALGKFLKRSPQRSTEAYMRVVLAAFVVFYGLRLSWISINGPFLSIIAQLLMVVIALALGKMLGRLLGLQKLSNRLGQAARDRMNRPGAAADKFNDGFLTCTMLFCAAPLGIVGSVQDGFSGYYYPLAAKAVIEGFAAFGFARMFGWGAAVSALPVLALQGSITLAVRLAAPALDAQSLIDPINAVGGLLVFSVALVMLELKRLPLADYLPALVVAPVLTWLIRLI
jgi:uncharacterized membrane protein YqgA involved in biofilm formation